MSLRSDREQNNIDAEVKKPQDKTVRLQPYVNEQKRIEKKSIEVKFSILKLQGAKEFDTLRDNQIEIAVIIEEKEV